MSYDTAQPYIASFTIFRDGNKVAFVLRENTDWMSGYYGLPSGKVEKGEAFSAAAIREAKEEAGVSVSPADLTQVLTVHRNEPGSFASDWVDIYFEAKKWEGKLHNAEPHVHSELTWLDLDALPDNVIPSVRTSLEAWRDGKNYFEYGWDATS